MGKHAYLIGVFGAALLLVGASLASAQEWSTTTLVSSSGDAYYPRPMTDGQGNWMTTWYTYPNPVWISVSQNQGDSWDEPVNVTGSVFNTFFPTVATDGKGLYLISYEVPSDLVAVGVRRSTDLGASWSTQTLVSGPYDANASNKGIATDGKGTWIVIGVKGVYSTNEITHWYARSTDNGVTWEYHDSGAGYFQGVASDRQHHWMMVSEVGTSFYATVSGDDGATWSPDKLVGTYNVEGSQGSVAGVAAGGDGVWIVTWSTGLAGVNTGTDQDIVCRRTTDNGVTWDSTQVVNTNATEDIGDDDTPRIGSDGHGDWVIVWASRFSLTGFARSNILSSVSTDDGITWGPPQIVNRDAPTENRTASSPAVASDGRGAWICNWNRYTIGADHDIYSAHLEIPLSTVTLISPYDGKCAAGNRVLVKAEVEGKRNAPRPASVRFEYRPTSTTQWLLIPAATTEHPNPDSTLPYYTHWDVTVLPSGLYDLRAVATYNEAVDSVSPVITVAVEPDCGNGQVVGDLGQVIASAVVEGSSDARIAAADGTGPSSIEMRIPAGSLPGNSEIQVLFPVPGTAQPARLLFGLPDLSADIRLPDDAVSAHPIALTFDYPDVDQDGLVDGTANRETDLAIRRTTPVGQSLFTDSTVDPDRNQVTCFIKEGGVYSLGGNVTDSGVRIWMMY